MNTSTARRLLIASLAAVVAATLVSGCSNERADGDATPVTVAVSDDELRTVYATWINQLGLVRDDPDIWRVRLSEACSLGVWDPDVARQLAERYVVEDEAVSARAPDTEPPTIGDAADSLWLMALQVCPDEFPADAVADGPPSMTDGT